MQPPDVSNASISGLSRYREKNDLLNSANYSPKTSVLYIQMRIRNDELRSLVRFLNKS